MPLAPPATVSPGKILIDYITENGIRHSFGVNLMVGAFPATRSEAEIQALELAEMVALAMPAETYNVLGFRTLAWFPVEKAYQEVWAGGFVEEVAGEEGPWLGFPDAVSVTMTISGRGAAPGPTIQAGITHLVLYTGPRYVVPPDVNRINITTAGYEALAVLAASLSSAEGYYADVYGQKATANGYITPQINAHWQRRRGL